MVNRRKELIEKLYKIPCGPMEIRADGVCRRSLRDSLDALLDRLTEEVNPCPLRSSKLPPNLQVNPDGKTFSSVELQGNSKMLQDISGRIEPR